MDIAVYGISDGRGINFSVGDIPLSRTFYRADTFYAKAEVGVLCDDPDAVGLVHNGFQLVHRPVHFAVIQSANVKIELFKGVCGHPCLFRHTFGGIAQHHPLGFVDAQFVMYGMRIQSVVNTRSFAVNIGQLVAVIAAAYADIRVHFSHSVRIVLRHQLRQLFRHTAPDGTSYTHILYGHKGVSADFVHFIDYGVDQHIVYAACLDQDLFALFQFAGIIYQYFRKFFYSGICHTVSLFVFFFSRFTGYTRFSFFASISTL